MEYDVIVVEPYRLNCSILWCERTRRAAVVDPGGDLDRIADAVDLLEVVPEVVLITHGHFDHAGAASEFAAALGLRIEGPHRDEAALIQRNPEVARSHGRTASAYTPDRWLEDGDVVRFGDVELRAIHCPGHSRGHMVYFSAADRVAFVGDVLFRGTIGAWDHADGDLETLVTSIRRRLFPLGDDVEFVPGHGESSTFGRERRLNPLVGDAVWAMRSGPGGAA